MSRVGVDLDGVCYDFGGALREFLQQRGHDGPFPDPTRWEFYEDWGYSLEEFIDLYHQGVDAGVILMYGDPFPGTRDAITRMRKAGHTIHIVTDRSFGTNGASESATRTWLDTHKIPFDSLTFSADKTIVNVDWFVDDKLQNYDALRAQHVQCYLMDRPWNQEPSLQNSRFRVYSLDQFASKVILSV